MPVPVPMPGMVQGSPVIRGEEEDLVSPLTAGTAGTGGSPKGGRGRFNFEGVGGGGEMGGRVSGVSAGGVPSPGGLVNGGLVVPVTGDGDAAGRSNSIYERTGMSPIIG